MREYMRMQLLSWSEFVKINYFSKQLGLNSSNVSNFIKYGAHSLSDDNVRALYEAVLEAMRKIA